jgi:hypothetical protein
MPPEPFCTFEAFQEPRQIHTDPVVQMLNVISRKKYCEMNFKKLNSTSSNTASKVSITTYLKAL